jgi:uncharacterized membrane protein YqjE
MDLNTPPSGIPSRISGLLFALLRHALALTELAAQETQILIRQSVAAILLLIAFIVVVVISYLGLLATVISLLAIGHGWCWPAAFGVVALFHLLLAGMILVILKNRSIPRPYEATTSELRRDLESLGKYSQNNPSNSPQ